MYIWQIVILGKVLLIAVAMLEFLMLTVSLFDDVGIYPISWAFAYDVIGGGDFLL